MRSNNRGTNHARKNSEPRRRRIEQNANPQLEGGMKETILTTTEQRPRTLAVGLILAGSGSTAAAWTVYVLTIPFMMFILPYFMGVVLIQHSDPRDKHDAQEAI